MKTPQSTEIVRVTTDGEHSFPAVLLRDAEGNAILWNGFVNPCFDRETAEQICQLWSQPDYGDGDTYRVMDNGCVEIDQRAHYPEDPIEIIEPSAGEHGYSMFTFGYTWQIAEPEAEIDQADLREAVANLADLTGEPAEQIAARCSIDQQCPTCRGTGGGQWNDCPTCDGNGVI